MVSTHFDSDRGGSILVVDDDDDIREVVRQLLDDEGYRTSGASNGKEALEVALAEHDGPALILLDLMMPVMDGWEFLVRIEDEPTLNRVPVALMSAHPKIRRALDKERDRGAALLLLPKPLDVVHLMTIVRRFCAGKPTEPVPTTTDG